MIIVTPNIRRKCPKKLSDMANTNLANAEIVGTEDQPPL